MSQLERLVLNGTRITDAGLKHVGGLTRLYRLNLGLTDITGAGLAHLAELANLKELDLPHTDHRHQLAFSSISGPAACPEPYRHSAHRRWTEPPHEHEAP